MKENFIHVCFVIDSSGSMFRSESDVIGGFSRVINEQKSNKNGSCVVSVIDFNTTPEIVYLGKDVSEVDPNFNYVIARLRVLLEDQGTRSHYCIMKREESSDGKKSYAQIKQN